LCDEAREEKPQATRQSAGATTPFPKRVRSTISARVSREDQSATRFRAMVLSIWRKFADYAGFGTSIIGQGPQIA
jgi:hypothetical protein